jgi:hypothetical protein
MARHYWLVIPSTSMCTHLTYMVIYGAMTATGMGVGVVVGVSPFTCVIFEGNPYLRCSYGCLFPFDIALILVFSTNRHCVMLIVR